MKQIITKSDKNLKILNSLISSGFYTGYVSLKKFELTPNRFPNNHRIIGILNDSGNYDLKFDFKPPMNIIGKILIGLGILTIIVSLINENWILPIALISLGLIFFAIFKLKEKEEINRLTNKILEFHSLEHK